MFAVLAEAEKENKVFVSAQRLLSDFPPLWLREPDNKTFEHLDCIWCKTKFEQTTFSDWSLHMTKHIAPEVYSSLLKQIKVLNGPKEHLLMDQYLCSVCKFPTKSKLHLCRDIVCAFKRRNPLVKMSLSHTV